MKVDLSKGGKIAKAQKFSTTAPKSAKIVAPVSEDENDDDESSSFFLPKSGVVAPRKIIPKKPSENVEKVDKRFQKGTQKSKIIVIFVFLNI